MRIAHIVPPWYPVPAEGYGGTEAVLGHLIDEQVRQGHNVVLYGPGDARTNASHRYMVAHSIIPAGGTWLDDRPVRQYYESAIRLASSSDHHVVHLNLSAHADVLLFELLQQLTKPYIVTLHSRFPFDHQGLGKLDHQLIAVWGAKTPLVAISESARKDALQFDPKLSFLGVVYHGLPKADFPTVMIPSDYFYFTWIGRITPDKGTHLAAQAAIKAGVPLIIAGIVDPHVPRDVDYFEREIQPLLSGAIRYIGPVDSAKKLNLFARSRGMLNPILWEEPFGMVMIEAMACGCPVISFARGAAPEVVGRHREGGILVDTLKEMVEAMQQINTLHRPNIQKYARANFSVEQMAREYEKMYQRAIAQWHG